MNGLKKRAASAALVSIALSGLAAAPALATPGVTVGSVSSLAAGARAGTVEGNVLNRTARTVTAKVSVRVQRTGAAAKFVGHTAVRVPAHGSAVFTAAVKLPGGLSRGTYYLAACTDASGQLGCATSQRDIRIHGGFAVRGSAVRLPGATAHAAAEDCTSGAHTLAKPGERVYPELGNGGYASLHSDVFINYDAVTNLFLPGTHVDLQQRSTQCLSDFSVDLNHKNSAATTLPRPDLTVGSVT